MMRLLVAVDLGDRTPEVIDVASRMAMLGRSSVVLLHVAEPEPEFVGYDAGPHVVREQVAHEFREQHRRLQEYAEQMRAGEMEATALLIQGPTAKTILAEAERREAEIIIMGTHGRSATFDLAIGSVSQSVLRSARIPVLLVPLRRA